MARSSNGQKSNFWQFICLYYDLFNGIFNLRSFGVPQKLRTHTHIKNGSSQSYTGYTPNVLPDYHCAAPHSIILTTRKFSLLLVWVSRVCMDIILICLLFDADGALQPGHDIIPNIRVRLKSGLAPSSFWTELCCILPRPNSSATNWSSLRAGISKFGLCTNHTQLSSIYKY